MPQSGAAAVEARAVSLDFSSVDGVVQALSAVDLRVEQREFITLIGPSGCGKTTLLRCLADLESPTSGSLEICGRSAREARLDRLCGYVFQSPALLPWRTVEANVGLPHEVFGTPRQEYQQAVRENLELVGLSGFAAKYPWQLSGGMQQRVSIARALSFNPQLLLMDEPFGALDEITREHLNQELLATWRRTGKTIVFVTHSISEAVFLSTRVAVMTARPGRIAALIDIDLPANREAKVRDCARFVALAAEVRQALASGNS